MDKIAWLRDLIYLIPVGGLIWKMAQLHSQVKQNTEDIKECQKVNHEQSQDILDTLRVMTESINEIKIDVAVLKATQMKATQSDKGSPQIIHS